MRKPYFPRQADAPEPLRMTVARTVRFEEVDPLSIVWHGRYPSYFEDGRVLLGERYGIGYMDFYDNGILAPIKQMHVDYHRPLHFREEFTIEAILHWSEAARLNHEFILRDSGEQVATTGYTVQMMMDPDKNILLVPPEFYQQFLERWRNGELT